MYRIPFSCLHPVLLGVLLALTGAGALSADSTVSKPAGAGRTENITSLNIGDNAWEQPGGALPSLGGGSYRLDHWQGKVVLLNFWASWCSPCQYEIPGLVRLQQRHAAQGLQVVGVGVDKSRPLSNVSRSLGINYPVLVAGEAVGSQLLRHWGDSSQTLPYNVVIGKDGTIHYAGVGQFDEEMFDTYVTPLLAQP